MLCSVTLQLLLREFANDVAVPGVDSENFNDAATDQSVDISVNNRAALVLLSTIEQKVAAAANRSQFFSDNSPFFPNRFS